MKIDNLEKDDFVYQGQRFIGREYITSIPTDVMCLFFHGVGEKGPEDGSELWEVEKNNGWPKFAKGERYPAQMNGYNEYPFHIFAIQIATEYHDGILHKIIPACKERYGVKRFIIVGISLGCRALYELLQEAGDESIKVVVPVAGDGQDGNKVELMPTVQGMAWHSLYDPTVRYQPHRDLVDAYNSYHKPKGGHIYFNTLQDKSHAAWNRAFNPSMEDDKSLDFALKVLKIGKYAEAPTPTDPNLPGPIDDALALMNYMNSIMTPAEQNKLIDLGVNLMNSLKR